MCSNFSKHHSVLDFCLFECNYHPLERLCFILWAAKFLKSGRWTDSSRNKSMYYFTEHSELEGTHKESNSQWMAHMGIKAVPSVLLALCSDHLSQSQARSWGLSHVCSYSTRISIHLKPLWKHRNWELQFLTVGLPSGHILNIKKISVAPQVNMKSCPAKPFIHSQVSTGRRPSYAGKVELEGSPKDSWQRSGTRKR